MIDFSKPLQTQDGREARVYATDGGGRYPVHGAVKQIDRWEPESWTIEGRYFSQEEGHDEDFVDSGAASSLINVPVN